MAKKKKSKKSKKVTKSAVPKKVVKKKVSLKKPKAAKKAKKAASNGKATVAALSTKAIGIVKRLDEIEIVMEEQQTLLEDLVNENGCSSFVHPKRGKFSVMVTKTGKFFWRPKPTGRVAA